MSSCSALSWGKEKVYKNYLNVIFLAVLLLTYHLTFIEINLLNKFQKMSHGMGLKGFTLQRSITGYIDETKKTDIRNINIKLIS